jgi:hypothetical protein
MDLLGEGPAVVIATRDGRMRPQIARAWAVQHIDGGAIRLCVEAAPRSRTRCNLDQHREIAVTMARPTTYRSVQIKGTVIELGAPTPEQRDLVDAHQRALAVEAAEVGMPGRLAARILNATSLVSVAVAVHEVYDQTPGTPAGEPL